ncbi:sugar nucleotide-binding protein [Granulicoccus sp. GXG6511]|uniref:sugar nucleotide-binding protein n=1 Tax=Granulicoccus sp. GXG6511 TaxID=3381351 RepID=UPI003D7F103D
MSSALTVAQTAIPGLFLIDLPLHGDERGWFKENWQRAKMTSLGLPDFHPVQQNVAFNAEVGVTRGVHAEPWDKLVSVVSGRIFGAWVDLREGDSFGHVVTLELGPEKAVFVPRGVGNAYQTLEPGTTYSYLVNEHWSESARDSYTFLNAADPAVGITWPIPLERSTRSAADLGHPALADVTPFAPRRTVILGGEGQLGRALARTIPSAEVFSRRELDLTAPQDFDWSGVGTIINAAAYTAVDAAEAERAAAWAVNVTGVRKLVGIAREHRATLVHVSSDYVFDGTQEVHTEEEPLSPLSFYGVTKAAGDELVATWDRHYIVRTSWVIGDGKNFITTMASLAERGIEPSVVDDQHGRLTFTDTLAEGIAHLLASGATFGTYNLTNSGPQMTWAEVAKAVFRECGRADGAVKPVTTAEYFLGRDMAPRPDHSTLDLGKISAAGFVPPPPPAGLRIAES